MGAFFRAVPSSLSIDFFSLLLCALFLEYSEFHLFEFFLFFLFFYSRKGNSDDRCEDDWERRGVNVIETLISRDNVIRNGAVPFKFKLLFDPAANRMFNHNKRLEIFQIKLEISINVETSFWKNRSRVMKLAIRGGWEIIAKLRMRFIGINMARLFSVDEKKLIDRGRIFSLEVIISTFDSKGKNFLHWFYHRFRFC